MRRALVAYSICCVMLVATSYLTGRNATLKTGEPYYLLTRTTVLVEKPVEADNETDAEFDRLFEEAGEQPTLTVEEPMFVLGFLDVTGPFIIGGGAILAGWSLWRRLRRPRALLGTESAK